MNLKEPNRILIVKLSAVGDLVMSLPFLIALKKRFPEAKIDWLVEKAALGIIENHPLINQVLVAPRKEIIKLLKKGRLLKAISLVKNFSKQIRQNNYDLVIDIQGLFKSAFWVYLSRAPRRLGFAKTREMAEHALNERLPPYDINKHAVYRYLDVAIYLGADFFDPKLKDFFPHYPQETKKAKELLNKNEAKNGPWIALNPGAKWDSKIWPKEHWRTLAQKLTKDNFNVLISGGKEDQALGEFISKNLANVLNLCGKTDLKTLAEIYRFSEIMISADTGPMHLAAACGTKVVAIFGPTYPERTAPIGPLVQIIQAQDLNCLRCFKRKCPLKNLKCMSEVSPKEIFLKIKQWLKS